MLTQAVLAHKMVAETALGELEDALELARSSVRSQAPPVSLGSQQREPVAVIAHVPSERFEFAARAHKSNSSTVYALQPKISSVPARPPPFGWRHTTNGR